MGIKYTCGVPFPSGCITFTGELPTFISPSDVPCDANLDSVIEKANEKIQRLLDENDLTGLDKKCYDFDPSNITIKDLHQKHIDLGCDHETRLTSIRTDFDNLDISAKIIDVDMGCLSPAIAACAQGSNLYSLLSVILTLKNEICSIKSYLNI